MKLLLTFGPPGTGKTESDLRLIERYLENGTSREEIAYVSFMKSAARDGARRMGISENDGRNLWFRTLHSTCFKVLGMGRGQVVTSAWLKAFGKKLGLAMKDDEDDAEKDAEDYAEAVLKMMTSLHQTKTTPEGSLFKGIYDLSRLLCRNVEALRGVLTYPHSKALAYTWPGFSVPAYQGFVSAYERQKVTDGKMDFVDMLAEVVRRKGTLEIPKWKLAVVDEVQDFSPLQFAVAEELFFPRCDFVVFSGDDDQAIFSFQGADAQDFLSYRSHPEAVVAVLRDTHRFGDDVVRFASKIIEKVQYRHPKDVRGLPDRNNTINDVYSLDPKAVHEGDLLLHRHVAGCSQIAGRLVAAGIPFWNERRGPNPFKHTAEVRAYLAWRKLSEEKPITGDDLQYLVGKVPSMSRDRKRLVHYGMKKKIENLAPGGQIPATEMKEFFTEDFMRDVKEKSYRHINCRFADYYHGLAEKGHDFSKTPKTRVATIHASKGRQAPRVWLWTEIYPKVASAGDDEHRVAYVGATRTEHDLYLVHEAVVGDWTTEYRYPESENRRLILDEQ